MKTFSYKIVATLIALSFSLAFASAASAEDGYGSAAQGSVPVQTADQNYAVPSTYQGQYYPQEQEPAIGYHATTNTSDNSAAASEDPYYLYYY